MTTLEIKEIREILQQGENASVEFKMGEVHPDSLAKEIVALSNTKGGIIFLGVNDEGEIMGLSDSSKNYEEWVSNISRNNVIPPVQLNFTYRKIEQKKIGVIEISKGKDKPYQTSKYQFLIRVGSTNRVATQMELLRLFQAVGAFHYDLVSIPSSSIRNLNLSKIDQYFSRYDLHFLEEEDTEKQQLLVNSDILSEEGEITIAGMLLFGINPTRKLPQSGITFAHFHGKEITDELIDKQNLDGNLDFLVDTTLSVLKNNILTPSKIEGAKRVDTKYMFPDKIFRELIVNACVHRDYSIRGSKIRIFMFEDRLEFINPGRLPNTITIEKLKVGVSLAVNPVIVKFMENMRYMDQLGRGLPMVYQEAKRNNRRVQFRELGDEFKVTLYFNEEFT